MALDKKSSSSRGTGKKVLLTLLVLVWLGVTGFLAYSFMDGRKETKDLRSQLGAANQQIEAYKANPQEAANAEVRRYVEEVSKLYTSLPTDEEPSVATVSDKSKLADQPFFAQAENGDVTLIYTKAKLAILYRPSAKKIVNVSTVSIQQNQEQE